MDLRKEFAEKRYLDTLMHSIVAIGLCLIFTFVFPSLSRNDIIFLVFLGSFFPDIDHLLLYKVGKFKNFKEFLRWNIKSNRYRIGFELFHNFPALIFVGVALPFLYLKNVYIFIFFVAFFFHLLVDVFIDKLVLRSLKQWRFSSKI